MDAVAAIFRDKVRTLVPLIEEANMPFNSLGDFVNPAQPYHYDNLVKNIGEDNSVFIDNVYVSKPAGLSFAQQANINPDVFSLIIDFELSQFRYPRQ